MNNLYHIDNNIAILSISKADTGIETQDQDEQGYLVQNGTQRGISFGFSPEGLLIIFLTTNGDPFPIYDNLDDASAACETLGDLPQETKERTLQGAERLLEACEHIKDLYPNNFEIEEAVQWYIDKANEVIEKADE